MKKKAFTLIELIAVLVILAILALIVTPLVMNIIRKAKISADKRSIDAYGRSIELAIAGYLMDTGTFPTSISQLTIEYSGDEVVCEFSQINPDSSVYLNGCKVKNRNVEGYAYGSDKSPTYNAYTVGDEVSYNNVEYYVIKDSGVKESTVTLLKAEPLTVDEVNQYGGVGTANNHVNMYVTSNTTSSYYQTAYNNDGYGGMAYYSSETCGYVNGSRVETDCTTDYAHSDIKYVVDAWKNAQAPSATEARLIFKNEIEENFEFEYYTIRYDWSSRTVYRIKNKWMYNYDYAYWIITNDNNYLYGVMDYGYIEKPGDGNLDDRLTVRPVIVLPKSVLN